MNIALVPDRTAIDLSLAVCKKITMSLSFFVILLIGLTLYELFFSAQTTWGLGAQILFILFPTSVTLGCIVGFVEIDIERDWNKNVSHYSEKDEVEYRTKIFVSLHLVVISAALTYINLFIIYRGM